MNIIYESLKKIKFLRKIIHKIRYSKEAKSKIKSLKFQTDRRVYKSILLFDLCNKSPKDGVIVECGVGKGSSLSVLSNISNKKIFAFDSYEGFPEEISKYDHKDLLPVLKFSKSHYKMMTIERVKENLLNNAFDKSGIEKIIFKKGFFPESFKDFNEEISFLHLDVDLYKSYKDCLEFFFPKVKVGGIITFDEYYEYISDITKKGWDWRGANVAIDEFVKENDLELKRHFTGYRYVIKNK